MEIVNTLIILVVLATLIQFIVDVIKNVLPKPVLVYISPRLIAVLLGVLLAVLFHIDVFGMLGMHTEYVLVAYILTGLIVSAGSGPVHELIAKLRESRDQFK